MSDKEKIITYIDKLLVKYPKNYYLLTVAEFIDSLQEEPVSEPNKELAETYLAVFNKKFPILPSLNGKQLADYKIFLNKCQQIFGLKEWGIRPIQSKLFEKLSLLWAVWGAEHLQGVGRQDEKEQDIPVSEELEEASFDYAESCKYDGGEKLLCVEHFKAGAKWQEEKDNEEKVLIYKHGFKDCKEQMMKNIWKPADGDDLPEIDREVIALLDNGKVVFAHRPPEFWDGKDIVTGKVTRYYPQKYDGGGWNIPNVKYWLDCQIPNMGRTKYERRT